MSSMDANLLLSSCCSPAGPRQMYNHGVCDASGGMMIDHFTRAQEPAFFNRAFMATTDIPNVPQGTPCAFGKHTDLETSMQYGCYTRLPGDNREYMIPDALNFDYLPYGWQQQDIAAFRLINDDRQTSLDKVQMAPSDVFQGSYYNGDAGGCKCFPFSQMIYPNDYKYNTGPDVYHNYKYKGLGI